MAIDWVNVILWSIAGTMLGGVTVIALPVVAGLGPTWLRQRAGDAYGKLMMYCLDSGAMVGHDELHAVDRNKSRNADEIAFDDDVHVEDSTRSVGRLHGRRFGFVPRSSNSYVSLLLAELGARAESAAEHGLLGEVVDENGQIQGMSQYLPLPAESKLVDPEDAVPLLAGDASPSSSRRSYQATKKSQEGFRQKLSLGQAVMILFGFVTGAATIFMAIKYGGGGAGAAPVNVPITLGIGGLL